jgi:hypothetical protein
MIRDISDKLIGWSNNKKYINTFIHDKKFNIPIYIEKEDETKMEETPFFYVNDQEEIIKFKGCIIQYFEYREIIDNLYYSQSEYMKKLDDIKEFIKSFKLKEKHEKFIKKALKLIENYIIASNFIDIIKVKPFVKEYIKNKRR